MRISQPTNSS